jgi:hypothetical protein
MRGHCPTCPRPAGRSSEPLGPPACSTGWNQFYAACVVLCFFKRLVMPNVAVGNASGLHTIEMPSRCALNPRIDFVAERTKIDRLGKKGLSAILQRLALGLRIAIGRDHDNWNVRPHGLGLRQ